MNEPLTPARRQALEAALRDRHRELTDRIEAHQGGLTRVEHAHEVLHQDGDDQAVREMEREVDRALHEFDLQERASVDAALVRMHHADFGLCLDCGNAIPWARLSTEPWALRCRPCEDAREAEVLAGHRLA